MLVFVGELKNWRIPRKMRDKNQQQTKSLILYIYVTLGAGFRLRPHKWKASDLTTVPSLLPILSFPVVIFSVYQFQYIYSEYQLLVELSALPETLWL